MLLPDFDVTQTDCNELIFRDTTPVYSAENPGGYGVFNIDADEIVKAVVSLDFGGNRRYEIEKIYKQSMPAWVISSRDIMIGETPEAGCSDCGTPCGCGGCSDSMKLSEDCNGYLSTFPSGCIIITYEVFIVGNISVGIASKKIVSTCHEDKKLLDIADKLTLGDPKCYDFHNKKETRIQTMQSVMLAWMKLEVIQNAKNMDCECVASSIKQVGLYLDSVQLP